MEEDNIAAVAETEPESATAESSTQAEAPASTTEATHDSTAGTDGAVVDGHADYIETPDHEASLGESITWDGAGPSSGQSQLLRELPTQREASYTDIIVVPSDSHGGPNFYDISSVNRKGESVSSRRRFDDLVQLHEDFKRRYRGCVIPFRPGKTYTNSSVIHTHGEDFLKDRAYAIKCYLLKVVQHPEMKESETLRQFMESSEVLRDSETWAREQVKQVSRVGGWLKNVKQVTGAVPRIPTPSQVLNGSAKTEHDLLRQMSEMRVKRSALYTHADASERALLELGDKFADMKKATDALSVGAQGLMVASRALLDGHADNGHGLHTLTKFEREAQIPSNLKLTPGALTTMNVCVEAFGRCCGEAMNKAIVRQMAILHPINDHAFTLPRVEKALAVRLDALVVLESLRRQEGIINASYQHLLAKEVSGSMRNHEVRRMNSVRTEVDQVRQAKAAGDQAYAQLKERNERDIQLYQTERGMSYCKMILNLAEAQAALQDAVADVWQSMARKAGVAAEVMADDMAGVAYSDLGLQVSHSAVLFEGEFQEGAAEAPKDVPLPAEHAAMADSAT